MECSKSGLNYSDSIHFFDENVNAINAEIILQTNKEIDLEVNVSFEDA
jgi:hypothetical protein